MARISSIVEFLIARYDEIEAAARAVAAELVTRNIAPIRQTEEYHLRATAWESGPYAIVGAHAVTVDFKPYCRSHVAVVDPTRPSIADHIALHDPAYVLADITAKRKILEEHAPFRGEYDKITGCETCSYRDDWEELQVEMPCPTLWLLALPFADHPDYQAEWTP